MWYPIIFVLSVFLILVIVVRRAMVLGVDNIENDSVKDKEEGSVNNLSLPNNPGEATDATQKWLKAEELYKEKKYFAAEKWYFDVVHMEPNHDRAFARLATIAMAQKRYHAAIDNFERSLSIMPNIPTRQFNLALAYFLAGEKKKAHVYIEKALTACPNKENYLQLRDKIKELP